MVREEPKIDKDRDEPSGKPPNDNPKELEEKRDKAREQLIKDIEDGNTEAMKGTQILLIKSNLNIIKFHADNIKDTRLRELFKTAFDGLADTITGNDYFKKDGTYDIDKLKSHFTDTSIDFSAIGINPDEIDDINRATNDFVNNSLPNMLTALDRVNNKFSGIIKKGMDGTPDLNDKNLISNTQTAEQAAERIADQVTPADERAYSRNVIDRGIEREKETGKPNTSNGVSFKDFAKFLAMLGKIASLAALVWLAVGWGLSHSGCMKYSCGTDDTILLSSKAICSSSGSSKVNIFNPQSNIIDYSSSNCNCNDPDKLEDCSQNSCNNNPQSPNIRPWGKSCQPGDKCVNVGGNCPTTKYQYDPFNPLSFIPDIFKTAVNAAGTTTLGILELLKKIGIYAAIIIGVLLLLYLVGEFIIKQKGTNDFGKYLGNINKFKNYGYLGRCNNIIPSRFGSF